MPPASGEIAFGGITFTPTGAWRILTIEGLGPAPIRVEEVAKPGAPGGSWIYAKRLGSRHIILTGVRISSPANIWTDMLTTFTSAFSPLDNDAAFEFNMPGIGSKKVMCRPADSAFQINAMFGGRGFAQWVADLVAGDPSILAN